MSDSPRVPIPSGQIKFTPSKGEPKLTLTRRQPAAIEQTTAITRQKIQDVLSATRAPWVRPDNTLEKRTSELEKTLSNLEQQLSEHEEHLACVNAALKEKERELAETEALIHARERILAQRSSDQERHALDAYKAELDQQAARLVEAKNDLARREALLEERYRALNG